MAKLTFKIWLLLVVLALSTLSIFSFPPTFFEKGVVIKAIDPNSTYSVAGLKQGDIITSINNQKIKDMQDYGEIIDSIFTENKSVKIIINTKTDEYILFTNETPKIIVQDIPKTRIKTGLDLQGGARALVKPEKKLTLKEMDDLIAISNNRFNIYGISDVNIRPARDLSGNLFMLIEIAGATPKDLEDLVAKQGKFEAKIGNETVFVGGNKDITYVARSGQDALIESCQSFREGEICNFRFTIYLSEEAAQRHANITKNLSVNITEGGRYLNKKLDLYVDGVLLDSLLISEELKGKATTMVSIRGSEIGATRQEAIKNTQANMKKLQTILITGSLPYKLEVLKLDTISPLLGQRFTSLIFLTGLAALGAVVIIVLFRYKNLKAALALLFSSFSEIFIILGVAALIKWNLDLPSIAGILVTIGTGVDQYIVILDESATGIEYSMKERLRRALFIVVSAYFTTLVALLPLYWAGAGLLKGFALTTIIGITIGVLITRPAFADMIKKISDKNVTK